MSDALVQGEINGGEMRGQFWLWVCTVNWGRGYDPGVFKQNVLRVIRKYKGRLHAVLLVQELDEEPDPAHEHRQLDSALEPGTKKAAWPLREPIILSPAFDMLRVRTRVTMESGGKIGGPKGTGPTRHAVTCIGKDGDLEVGFGNTHPHRNMPGAPKVQLARRHGSRVFAEELVDLYKSRGGTSVVWGADYNDPNPPTMIPGERVAVHRGLDHIRYKNHPRGVHLDLRDTGRLNGTIDPHDPLWALFRVAA